jgi:hypothetical protein
MSIAWIFHFLSFRFELVYDYESFSFPLSCSLYSLHCHKQNVLSRAHPEEYSSE